MDIFEEIEQNKFVLVLLNEAEYLEQLGKIVKLVEKAEKKICYVCLSRPYKNVMDDLKENSIDIKPFFFVDVLSSHYGKPPEKRNCIFVESPKSLEKIRDAIRKIVEKQRCSVLLFDTISALLIYQESFSILHFTNSLFDYKKENVKKIFIALKNNDILGGENTKLVDDLKMFADKTLEVS